MKRFCLVLLAQFVFASVSFGQAQLRMIGWNLEGNGQARLSFIEDQVEAKDGVHLWGFSEVNPDRADEIAAAVGSDEDGSFESILGTTGGNIRLQIVYDADKLELVQSQELTDQFDDLASVNRQRIPLVGHFKGKTTGQEFKFVVNHLNRGDSSLRHRQADALCAWAISQNVPVIMCGDFNFDFHVFNGDSGVRDEGFDNLTDGGLVTWLRPLSLVKTEDNDRFVTVLDFFFHTSPPAGWSGQSRILSRTGDTVATTLDFDDNSTTMDHRPVDAILNFVEADDGEEPDADGEEPPADGDTPDESTETIQSILERLEALEEEMQELREAVESIE